MASGQAINKNAGAAFASTHWSVVLAAGNVDSEQATAALEALCRTYWSPLYTYVRRRGYAPHDAEDLTQEFFARLLSRDFLLGVGPSKGKFRSFLLASLNHFLANDYERSRATKRGGGIKPISLDLEEAEAWCQSRLVTYLSPEMLYDRQWAIQLLRRALLALEMEYDADGKNLFFIRLKRFLEDEVAPGDYAKAATELGLTSNAIAVAVHRMRRRYHELLRTEILQTVSTAHEIDVELEYLLQCLASN